LERTKEWLVVLLVVVVLLKDAIVCRAILSEAEIVAHALSYELTRELVQEVIIISNPHDKALQIRYVSNTIFEIDVVIIQTRGREQDVDVRFGKPVVHF
jgi:hypothetical protein